MLSCDIPSRSRCSAAGTPFHCLHATSHALQPMHTDVSVKNPTRGGWLDVPGVARDVVERTEEAVHAIPALRR